jgi:ABC-type uncharacterized transport system auxiliary subunit
MSTELCGDRRGAAARGPRLPRRRPRPPLPALPVAALLLAGCLGGPAPVLTDYTLEYPPPQLAALPALPVEINVELLAASGAVGGPEMLYQQKPFSLNAYTYDRWAADPVTLVQSFLVRDMQGSGLFAGVFEYRENLRARYRLTVTLEEFWEEDAGEVAHARIRLRASLLDVGEGGQSLLFQRSYQAQGPEAAQNAGGLAASMSQAMREVSASLIADVRSALAGAPAAQTGARAKPDG